MKFESDISEYIIVKGNFYFNTKRDLFLRKYFFGGECKNMFSILCDTVNTKINIMFRYFLFNEKREYKTEEQQRVQPIIIE